MKAFHVPRSLCSKTTGWRLLKRIPTREEAMALGHVPQRWFDEQPL